MALLVVFLVLAAQFESWINPLHHHADRAARGRWRRSSAWCSPGRSLNIYSQIGMILLVGLMAKNGILIVEFANQLRERGYSVREAVIEASVMRLRPILMTSIAMIGGAIPLALVAGAGAEARNAIGTVIVGGVTLSTLLTVLVVPSIYLLIGGYTKPATYVGELLDKLRQQTGLRPHGEAVKPSEHRESGPRSSGRVAERSSIEKVARADPKFVRPDLTRTNGRVPAVENTAIEAAVAIAEIDLKLRSYRKRHRPSAPMPERFRILRWQDQRCETP